MVSVGFIFPKSLVKPTPEYLKQGDGQYDDDDGIYRRLEAKFDLCVLKAL